MEEAFASAHRRARRAGRTAMLRLWARESWDLVRTAWSLRRSVEDRPDPRARPAIGSAFRVLADDVTLAVRSATRQSGFFALAALTLALGVGATTAMYGALKTVVLDPLPFPGSERMVSVGRSFGASGADVRLALEAEQASALRQERGVFDAVEAVAPGTVTLTGPGDPERIAVLRVTPGVPAMMGVSARLGRTFTAEEAAGEGERVAVLSYGFWRSRFGGREDVIGRAIQLNGEPWTVIGVLPRNAVRPDGSPQTAAMWLPLGDATPFRFTLARLAEGVSPEAAMSRVDALVRAGSDGALAGVVESIRKGGPLDETLRILMIGVTLLLLVACGNVSSLLLQRAMSRELDTAVRAALGAGRMRLVRQFAFESALLASAGAILGAALAWGGLRMLLALRPESFDALGYVRIDGDVLMFCIALSAAAGLLAGILPAVRATRAGGTAVLGRSGRGLVSGSARLRWAMVGAEVAFSFALLIGAAVVTASLRELSARDPGFRVEGLVAVDVRLPSWRHANAAARAAAMDAVLAAVRRVPRVESAVHATSVPPRVGIGRLGHVEVEGRPRESEPTGFHVIEAAPGFLETLGVPVVAGRRLVADDALQTDVQPVVLSEAAAARLFPDDGALGRRFRIEGPPDYTVVGVVRDMSATGLSNPAAPPVLHLPLRGGPAQMVIAVRARDTDARLLLDLRQAVRHAESDAVVDVATMRELLHSSIGRERFATVLLSVFAALAVILAAVGLHGVLSQVVVARTREIGLRMALGADAARIGSFVLRGGLAVTAAGLLAGAVLAAAGIRILRSEVFGLAAHQPAAYIAAAVVLVAVATLAMLVPALRAARLDPLRALSTE